MVKRQGKGFILVMDLSSAAYKSALQQMANLKPESSETYFGGVVLAEVVSGIFVSRRLFWDGPLHTGPALATQLYLFNRRIHTCLGKKTDLCRHKT